MSQPKKESYVLMNPRPGIVGAWIENNVLCVRYSVRNVLKKEYTSPARAKGAYALRYQSLKFYDRPSWEKL